MNNRSDGENEEKEGSHGDLHPLSGQSGSGRGWADTVSFLAGHPRGALSSLDSDHFRGGGGGETMVLPSCLLPLVKGIELNFAETEGGRTSE